MIFDKQSRNVTGVGSSFLRHLWRAWPIIASIAALQACNGPKFPNCETDEQCSGAGYGDKKLICVDRKCVQCMDNSRCDVGMECRAGACETIVGYCDNARPCPAESTCGEDHKCHVTPKPIASLPPVECDEQHPCAEQGARCQNNHCVSPPRGGPGCKDFPAPHFDFESPELRDDARQVLQRLATCILTGSLKGSKVLLTGHCDARGEHEFNMSLGAERAEAVKTFLIGLGLQSDQVATSSRGELDAAGTDESGWSNDRRVDVEVR